VGAEIFIVRMKVQRVEGGGRILLGDNTGGGTVMLQPIKFQKVGVRISNSVSNFVKLDYSRIFRSGTNA
jgi:hypothetical protein